MSTTVHGANIIDGVSTATTPLAGDNSTKLATTAFVQSTTTSAITTAITSALANINPQGVRITLGIIAPSNPVNGQELWFNTTSGSPVIQYYSGGIWNTFGAAYL